MRLLGWLAARGRSEKAGRASGEMRRISFEEKIFSFSKFLLFLLYFAKMDVDTRENRFIFFTFHDNFVPEILCWRSNGRKGER